MFKMPKPAPRTVKKIGENCRNWTFLGTRQKETAQDAEKGQKVERSKLESSLEQI